MKVERTQGFTPITITLETEGEARLVHMAIGKTVTKHDADHLMKTYGYAEVDAYREAQAMGTLYSHLGRAIDG